MEKTYTAAARSKVDDMREVQCDLVCTAERRSMIGRVVVK